MNASSSLAKRAAAVAASGCTKLLVRNSASEFSPHCVCGSPSRTASVSSRTPGGRSTRGIFFGSLMVDLPSVMHDALQGEARTIGVLLVLALRAPLRRDGVEVRGRHVAGDVVAVEARSLEAVELRVQRRHHALHPRHILV